MTRSDEVLDLTELKEWATELGRPWNWVLEAAGARPDSRMTSWRLEQGEAPRVRRNIMNVLTREELKREKRTSTGSIVLGLHEWTTLGRKLATLDPDSFQKRLAALRELVSNAEVAAAAAKAFESPK